MIDTGADDGQADGDVDTAHGCVLTGRRVDSKAGDLERDVALVVVHRNDDIIRAAHRFDEDGVGRDRPRDVVAFGFCCLDGGDDLVRFFVSEEAVLGAVGIEPGHGDAWMFVAEELHRVIGQVDDFEDARFFHTVARFAQRYVRRDMDDAELPIRADAAREQHRVFRCVRVLGEDFRVATVVVARQVERLFVDGRRDDGVHFFIQREGDAFLDVAEANIAAEGGDFFILPAVRLEEVPIDVVDRAIFAFCLDRLLDLMQLQIEVAKTDGVFEGRFVADDDGDGVLVDVRLGEGLDTDFRADASGVAHRDGEAFAFLCHLEITVLDFLANLGR